MPGEGGQLVGSRLHESLDLGRIALEPLQTHPLRILAGPAGRVPGASLVVM
jgi:hypothetical protein